MSEGEIFGGQNNQIDVSFHPPKSLWGFDEILADKIQAKKDKGKKISPPPPSGSKRVKK